MSVSTYFKIFVVVFNIFPVAKSQSVAAAGSSSRGNRCDDGVRARALWKVLLCDRVTDVTRRLFFEMELQQALQLSQAHK